MKVAYKMATFYLISILMFSLLVSLYLSRIDISLSKPIDQPYEKRSSFYLRHEKRFLGFLVLAVGSDYLIMSKIGLSDLLTVRDSMNRKMKVSARLNLLNQKVDYVLCDKKTAQIICAIDLFHKEKINPHYLRHCIARNQLFQSAELPWVRIPIKQTYQVPSIKKLIRETVQQHQVENRETTGIEKRKQNRDYSTG